VKRQLFLFVICVILASTIFLAGCPGGQAKNSETSPTNSAAGTGGHDHDASAMDKMKAELAKLSAEDAASAEKQHVCPVSGKMLGTMGAPIKVDVKGTQVWICCEGCREELLANADTYLEKLRK
jgi:hypothetical protein